ncbi:ROK family transcriptional regulator [Paramicrobacterium chengjingii]|uniref:ROK family transcriptional regulator n=1 Tax=Paramicrobacterium chengjingii TaxID=2769067 RepID=A0ABX6YKA8_9MICO|nr:ROK family transcriptional regulator [Microbacterium chengjingii]QPZ39198.1 ROK family transcriptional regulator [Microbacterium chengjingii]
MREATNRSSTATSNTVSRVNRTAIVQALREQGPLSRQQIGAITGLSPATVNRLTSSLIDEGLVARQGQIPSTGGRPSVLLSYTGATQLVACVQVRADRARGALIDFDSHFVHRVDAQFDDLPPADSHTTVDTDVRLSRTLNLLDTLLETARALGTPCVSVGVSVPGVVTQPDGRVAHLPELGWPEFPLKELIAARTELPIVIENDANALALGEMHHGVGRGMSSLIAVHLENGLGAGIISNGRIHHGFRWEAGEIGYLLMEPSSLEKSYSLLGDLEDRVGSVALTRKARSRGLEIPDGHLLMADEIFARAAQGEVVPAGMASEILDMVAMAVGAMSIILDPEVIVLGSGLASHVEMVIPAIEDRLAGRIIRVPHMKPATFVEDGVLVGIAELAALDVRGFTYVAG